MMTTLGTLLGDQMEETFTSFDLQEVQDVLSNLRNTNVIDIAHCELLQQQSLRAADILSEFIGRVIKTVSYLESKLNTAKNKAALEYNPPTGKATADLRRQAGESDPVVADLADRLARAKGAKELLTRKYDIIIKSHHYYKDLTAGMKRGIVGYGNTSNVVSGYE
jgi:hypothetical protein